MFVMYVNLSTMRPTFDFRSLRLLGVWIALSVLSYTSVISQARTLERPAGLRKDTYRMVQRFDGFEEVNLKRSGHGGADNRVNMDPDRNGNEEDVGIPIPNFPARSGIPGKLDKAKTPMLVYFSFDDAIQIENIGYYRRFFASNYKNPNGCPIRATFFNSGNFTNYGFVKELYQAGHELASHSRTHREPPEWWNNATLEQWKWEIEGQREDISAKAGIPKDQIIGMRAPFLALGRDTQYKMLEANKFSFDASMGNIGTPMWPFTMDAKSDASVCTQGLTCPTLNHRLWQAPLFTYEYQGHRQCAMLDSCRPESEADTFKFLEDNFNLHYNSPDKPAFGLNMHAAWFTISHYRADAIERFIKKLLTLKDVYIVPITKVLLWMDSPTPLDKLKTFKPFSC